ncbi:MAG: hypothetical protein IPQ07_32395 [Myxococcales bacterium]|nr:hypothetical protein [Myxococcales bacterium]
MKTFLVLVTLGGVAGAEPKIPQEVTDLLKIVTGTWKCTGTATLGADPAQPLTATLRTRSDLDGFWIHDTFEAKVARPSAVVHDAPAGGGGAGGPAPPRASDRACRTR